jgi:dihydrofolate reductase
MEFIVAMDDKGGIAKGGKIPWHIPEDLKFFRGKTEHHIVIMGKKTFDSFPNKTPLKNRLHIVLTRKPDQCIQHPNVIFTDTIDWISSFFPSKQHYSYLDENPKKYVIGGAEIYRLFFSQCRSGWVTYIKGDFDCDVFFPNGQIINNNIKPENIIEDTDGYCIYRII